MQYRNFGKLNWKASELGFGVMRLPIIGNDQSNVDQAESIRMIRYAIDQGINYLDTGYPYHNGLSERLVGLALKDGYRQKMKLATKLPARMVEKPEDFDRFLSEQLDRLQMDKLDFYLLHGLTAQSWPKVRDFGIIPWAEKKMSQGLFDYLGFSFHDNYDTFKVIIDSYDNWTLSQIQYNYVGRLIKTQTLSHAPAAITANRAKMEWLSRASSKYTTRQLSMARLARDAPATRDSDHGD